MLFLIHFVLLMKCFATFAPQLGIYILFMPKYYALDFHATYVLNFYLN